MATNTPWGLSQQTTRVAQGIVRYDTASHGGYAVSAGMAATMRTHLRTIGELRGGRYWFEEDCAWCAVAIQWPAQFPGALQEAERTLANWYPDAYAAEFGAMPTAAQSLVVRDREFAAATREQFVTRTAWGDWHATVPQGYVGVCARRASDGTEAWKLLPAADHAAGTRVVDAYPDWTPHA